MAEEERKVVVDPTLAVVEIGVAHTAGLHLDHRLTRTGIGHDDRLDRHRRTFRARHDSANLLCHSDLRIKRPTGRRLEAAPGRLRVEVTRRADHAFARAQERLSSRRR